MILILQQPGTSIGKKSELITIKRNARQREVAVRQIESVVVLSQVQISHDAILLFAQHGIPILYMDRDKPLGALLPFAQHGFIATRRAQFDAYTDKRGFELVKSMLIAAAINKSRMLKYYARNRRRTDPQKADLIVGYADQIETFIDRMKELGSELEDGNRKPYGKLEEKSKEQTTEIVSETHLTERKQELERGLEENKILDIDLKRDNEKKIQTFETQKSEEEPQNIDVTDTDSNQLLDNMKNILNANVNEDHEISIGTDLDDSMEMDGVPFAPSSGTNNKNKVLNIPKKKIFPKNGSSLENYKQLHPELQLNDQTPENESDKNAGFEEDDFENEPSGIKDKSFPLAKYRQSLMGLEGSAANLYFQALSLLFDSSLQYNGRNRRPPKDPVNAALSFGYHLLGKEVMVALTAAGLEPYAGFLHTDRSGRPSLVFDLIEEFRQPIVDRLAIRLFTHQILKPQDFESHGSEAGVRFTDEALSRYLTEFYYLLRKDGQKCGKTFMTYQQLILGQARKVVRYLLRKNEVYEGFTWNW